MAAMAGRWQAQPFGEVYFHFLAALEEKLTLAAVGIAWSGDNYSRAGNRLHGPGFRAVVASFRSSQNYQSPGDGISADSYLRLRVSRAGRKPHSFMESRA